MLVQEEVGRWRRNADNEDKEATEASATAPPPLTQVSGPCTGAAAIGDKQERGSCNQTYSRVRRSGFRICKPHGTFLWPDMSNSMLTPDSSQTAKPVEDLFLVPTPTSADSNTNSGPSLVLALPPPSTPSSPVRPVPHKTPSGNLPTTDYSYQLPKVGVSLNSCPNFHFLSLLLAIIITFFWPLKPSLSNVRNRMMSPNGLHKFATDKIWESWFLVREIMVSTFNSEMCLVITVVCCCTFAGDVREKWAGRRRQQQLHHECYSDGFPQHLAGPCHPLLRGGRRRLASPLVSTYICICIHHRRQISAIIVISELHPHVYDCWCWYMYVLAYRRITIHTLLVHVCPGNVHRFCC